MISNHDNEWLYNTTEAVPSPPTSLGTDRRTALGMIWKGCKCSGHQDIYSDWPTHNAELTIAQCMKTCVYCGKDFITAAELRKHMRKLEYARRNLRVCQESRGKGSSTTPSWTHIGTPVHRSESEPFARQPFARITRSQSVTDSANAIPSSW